MSKILNLFLLSVFTLSISFSQVPTDSLVAHYPFNGNANDESGKGNHGTVVGATLSFDRFNEPNSAYLFDGVNDYILIADNNSLDLTDNFCVTAWINSSDFNGPRGVISKYHTAGQASYTMRFWRDPVNIYFDMTSIYKEYLLNTNYWYFLTAQVVNDVIKLYINGELIHSAIGIETMVQNSDPVLIGSDYYPEPRFFSGRIDDLRIYNRVLNQSEIIALYNEGNASVQVQSPNGGENWTVGSIKNITWSSSYVTDVKIEYTSDNGSSWNTIINTTPSIGIYEWTIPNSPSSQCKVKITDISDPNVNDQSNELFTISQSSNPYISVVSPNGGEIWQVGSTHNIVWTSGNVVDTKIELSINNGASWTDIIPSTPSTGLYNWTIPNNPSIQCLIRISDTSNPNVYDISNSVFTIEIPSSLDELFPSRIPSEFVLIQNFPNPFNPATKIYYGVPELSFVEIDIYDVQGNKLTKLVSETKAAGYYDIEFDASSYTSGIYFYQLKAGSFAKTKKMVLMK